MDRIHLGICIGSDWWRGQTKKWKLTEEKNRSPQITFVLQHALTCVITCNPQTVAARKVLLPYFRNENIESCRVKRVYCFHKVSSWGRTPFPSPQLPLLRNSLGYMLLRRKSGGGWWRLRKRAGVFSKSGLVRVCNLSPPGVQWESMPDGEPGS